MPKIERQSATKLNRAMLTEPDNLFDAAVPVEQTLDKGYQFMIFGLSGTGKTTLACSFPKPLLVIRPEEVEDGTDSVRGVQGVSVTPPVTTPDQLSVICARQAETRRYRTLVVDGLTRFQDLVVKKAMGLEDVPLQQYWGLVPQADWLHIASIFKGFIRELFRLCQPEGDQPGTHVVLVVGERVLGGGGEDSSSIQIPTVMAALAPSICQFMHESCSHIVHTFKKRPKVQVKSKGVGGQETISLKPGKTRFFIHAAPHDLYATKLRIDRSLCETVPEEIMNPTFAILDSLIRTGQVQ